VLPPIAIIGGPARGGFPTGLSPTSKSHQNHSGIADFLLQPLRRLPQADETCGVPPRISQIVPFPSLAFGVTGALGSAAVPQTRSSDHPSIPPLRQNVAIRISLTDVHGVDVLNVRFVRPVKQNDLPGAARAFSSMAQVFACEEKRSRYATMRGFARSF